MVNQLEDADKDCIAFVIRPNQAMPWRTMVRLYLGIAAVTLAIGVAFFLQGLTLILPFSGIEVLALGIALYVCAWRSEIQEVIRISEHEIIFERGHNTPETREVFKRPWTKLILERSWNSWYPSRLIIRSRGRHTEIGEFLNEEERRGLAELLDQTLNNKNI